MKKIIILAFCVLLSSCDMEGLFGGTPEKESFLGERYLECFSTLLVPDYLIALENALAYDSYGYYATSTSSRDYVSSGKSLRAVGTEWTVNSKKSIKGVSIKCVAADTWELEWSGPYCLHAYSYRNDYYEREQDRDNDKYTYETRCKVTAKMLKETTTNHFDWQVVMDGERTEREGYACTFTSAPDMTFASSEGLRSRSSWDSCEGAATMIVTKNGEKVDMARMDYLGTDTRYFGGL